MRFVRNIQGSWCLKRLMAVKWKEKRQKGCSILRVIFSLGMTALCRRCCKASLPSIVCCMTAWPTLRFTMRKGTEMPKMQEMLMVFDMFKNPFWQREHCFHRLNLIAVFHPHLYNSAHDFCYQRSAGR